MSAHDDGEGYCLRIAGPGVRGVVTVGGATRKIRVNGKAYYFEWHHYFGPTLTTPDGRERKPLGEKHTWWKAVSWWHQQGKRIDPATGECVWQAVPEPKLIHLGGKHYMIDNSAAAPSHPADGAQA